MILPATFYRLKAFVQFTAAGAILNSYRVGSVNDNAVGSWTANLSPAMPAANGVALVSSDGTPCEIQATFASAGEIYITRTVAGVAADPASVSLTIFR